MSFVRLIYWSALIGGWSAFASWLVLELAFGRYIDRDTVDPDVRMFLAIFMAMLVAIPIGGGISFAGGLTNPKLTNLLKRLFLGFAGGLVGGLISSLAGACIFRVSEGTFLGPVARVLGWSLIGMGIGVGVGLSEGILNRSFRQVRNGIIGGVIGGLLGGLSFVPISQIAGATSSRALSFVLLGVFIGLFIGLAQVLLKESWLTVEAGFRAGRQLILGNDQITMGTSEKSSLIFIAYGAKGVEPIHLKITKQPDGGYVLEDNQSRTGTLLNGKPITAPTLLGDGDAIQFGVNIVRFNERVKHGHAAQRLPEPDTSKAPAKAMPTAAIQATAPSAVQPAKPAAKPEPVATPSAVQTAPAKPAPTPAAAPKPAATPQSQEGRCPICDRKVVGVPGERRCSKCFTTF